MDSLDTKGCAKRVACLFLSSTMAVLGFPMPSVAQTPQLLRAPEVLMSEADCNALLKHVNFLKDPAYGRQLRGTLASLEKLKAQAEQGKWDADRRLWEELKKRSEEYIQDLTKHAAKGMVKEAQETQYRALMRSMHARGVLPASPSLVWLKRAEDRFRELVFKLDKLGKVANRGGDVYREALTDAAGANSSALEAHDYAMRELLSEPALKGMGEELISSLKGSKLLPPYAEIGFKLGYLGVTAGFPAYERFVMAPRELANLQGEIDKMRDALQRIELDLAMDQRQYQRYCVERPTRQAQARPQPTPVSTPPSSTSSSPGFPLGGALLVGGLVAGAAALAGAAAGGMGGGSSAGGTGGSSNQCAGNSRAQCCTATSPGSSPVACAVRTQCGCPSGTSDIGATSCGPGEAFGTCRTCRC